jgi:hypothetical protein
MDFQGGFNQAWNQIATFVPKLVMFLVILAIGYFIASIAARIVARVLDRVGFNRLLDRGGMRNTLAGTSLRATDLLARLVKYAVVLITLQGAFNVFGSNAVSNLLSGVISWLPKAFVAIVLVVVAGAIARMVRDLVTNSLGGLSYGRFLGTLAWAFVWGVGILAALHQVGIATAITAPIMWAVMGTLAGVAVVGLGGGLIRPMQQRWEGWLNTVERDLPQISQNTAAGQSRTWYQTPAAGEEAGYAQGGYAGQGG